MVGVVFCVTHFKTLLDKIFSGVFGVIEYSQPVVRRLTRR